MYKESKEGLIQETANINLILKKSKTKRKQILEISSKTIFISSQNHKFNKIEKLVHKYVK